MRENDDSYLISTTVDPSQIGIKVFYYLNFAISFSVKNYFIYPFLYISDVFSVSILSQKSILLDWGGEGGAPYRQNRQKQQFTFAQESFKWWRTGKEYLRLVFF